MSGFERLQRPDGALDEALEAELDGERERESPPLAPGKRPLIGRARARSASRIPGRGNTTAVLARALQIGQSSAGRALDPSIARSFGARLGHDLGGVRVHQGEGSEICRALGVQALTLGRDIFFAGGAYDPESARGRALLAHELAHVAQHGGAAPGPAALRPGLDAAVEAQADRAAADLLAGAPARVDRAAPALRFRRDAIDPIELLVARIAGDPERARELLRHAEVDRDTVEQAVRRALGAAAESIIAATPARTQVGAAAAALEHARQHGERGPLPFRSMLERLLRRSFDGVEVLSGPGAKAAADMVGAIAFAAGNTVVLPRSPSPALVAHELTHVVQQGGRRVESGQPLETTTPGDAAEREADAVAAAVAGGLPISNLGSARAASTARLAREDTDPASAPADDAAAAGPDIETQVRDAGVVPDRLPITEQLFEYTVAAVEKTPSLLDYTGDLRKHLIAGGRKYWRHEIAKVDAVYLEQVARDLNDEKAKAKIDQIQAESFFEDGCDGDKLKQDFFKEVADNLENKDKPYFEAGFLYDKNGSAFTDVVSQEKGENKYNRRGRLISIPGSDLLHRTASLKGFYGVVAHERFRRDWAERLKALIQDEHKAKVAEMPWGGGEISGYEYWVHMVSHGWDDAGPQIEEHIDPEAELKGTNGTTWWSYKGIELEEITDPNLAHAGWTKVIHLLGLEPEWYADGAMKFSVKAAELQKELDRPDGPKLRKPTAFDGVLSPLYEPNLIPENGWGITCEGIPEAVSNFIPARVLDLDSLAPLPPPADRTFQKIADFMELHGTDAGKAEFSAAKKPRPVTIKVNPTFQVMVPGGVTGRVDIPNPAILHPGLHVDRVQLDVGEGGVRGGLVFGDLGASGAFSKEGLRMQLRPAEGSDAEVQAENEIDDVRTPLRDLLGRINSDARLTDDGVEAEMSVTPGPSGIPGFNLEEAQIVARYTGEAGVTADGKVGIAHRSGKVTGELETHWDGGQWNLTGTAQARDLIEGLEPFTVEVERVGEQTDIRTGTDVVFSRTLGAVQLEGRASELSYDVNEGSFAGTLDVDADLGMLGQASASARIADNDIDEMSFTLTTAELQYPREGDPVVKGQANGSVSYREGKFSGDIGGEAALRLPGVFGGDGQEATGLAVDVRVTDQGNYAGSIKTTTPVPLGQYLRIDAASLDLAEDGSVAGRVTANLLDIPFLERGAITWALDGDGVRVESVDAKLAGSLDRFGADRISFDLQLTEAGIAGSIDIAEGPSGIAGIGLGASKITFTYAGGQATASGRFPITHEGGAFEGEIAIAWEDGWKLSGEAEVRDFIPGVKPFNVKISQEDDDIRIYAERFEYEKRFGAIDLTGSGQELEYDSDKGTFSGEVSLELDLGMFGSATAEGAIADNELKSAVISYEAPQLRYPAEGATPVLSSDDVSAQLRFAEGAFSGSISGTANLALPGILGGTDDQAAGLAVSVQVGGDGSYSGSIRTDGAVTVGTFLRIDELNAELSESGGLSGEFTMNVINVPLLKKGEVVCGFTEEGLEVKKIDAEIEGNLEALGVNRVDVSLRLTESGVGGSIGVTAGPSGIPGFDLQESNVEFMYSGGNLTASGSFGFTHETGKISGSMDLAWSEDGWTYHGEGEVADLIEGLQPFKVTIDHGPDGTTVGVKEVEFHKDFGAVTMTGRAEEMSYDVTRKAFAGQISLAADLGMFGEASASATIANNRIQVGELTYDSPELKYPPGSDSPLISGTVGGSVRYNEGQFFGSLRSDATMHLPGLLASAEGDEALGVEVNVRVNPEGTYSGSVRMTRPVQIGDYFRIQALEGELTEEGDINSEFTVDIVNLSFANDVSLTCAIDENGFSVKEASAEIPYEIGERAWGAIKAEYSTSDGFTLTGNTNLRIRDDLIATGEVSYSTKTNEVNAELGVDEITILNKRVERNLVSLKKQIPVFSAAGIAGLFIEVRFNLDFRFLFDLSLDPSIKIEGLDLDDFSFDKAGAEIGMNGELSAELAAVPGLGVGIFAIHPSLLRGTGGLELEIVARSAIVPEGKLAVDFDQDGNVSGDARVAMPVSFGIDAALKPYAELVVLDGVWEEPWQGEPLAEFEILPERELFNFTLDLGGELKEQPPPEIPQEARAPAEPAADKVLEPSEEKDDAVQTSPAEVEGEPSGGAENDSGFDLAGIISRVLDSPSLAPIKDIIESAAETWEAIKDGLNAVVEFFTGWFDFISETVSDVLKGIEEAGGLFAYIKVLVKRWLGDDLAYILEPMLDAFIDGEDQLIELFDREPPGPDNFIDFTLDFLVDFAGFAWDSLDRIVDAAEMVYDRFSSQGAKLINKLIQEGRLGVQRHDYYIWRPFENYYFLAPTEYKYQLTGAPAHEKDEGMINSPTSVIGYGIWAALEAMDGVHRTNESIEEDSGWPWNDYWVD